MKAVILARVSTKRQEQEGLSIDNQLDVMKKYALNKNIKIEKIFQFSETADRGIRKNFFEMIDFVKKRKDIEAIIAYRVDRITRNYRDAVAMEDLRLDYNKELHFVQDNLIVNRKSRGIVLTQLDMSAFTGKQTINRLKEDAYMTIEKKIRDKEWIGKAPTGYLNIRDSETNKTDIIVDKDRAYLIRRGFELYSTGNYSLRKVAEILEEKGLTNNCKSHKPLTISQVYIMINNPFYYGYMRIEGKIHQHRYEPLIDKWLFDKCQEVKNKYHKKPFKYASKPFVFRGLAQCGYCGRSIVSDKKKGKYTYLFCTKYKTDCQNKNTREEPVIEQIAENFKLFKIPKNVLVDLKEELKKTHEEKKTHNQICKLPCMMPSSH